MWLRCDSFSHLHNMVAPNGHINQFSERTLSFLLLNMGLFKSMSIQEYYLKSMRISRIRPLPTTLPLLMSNASRKNGKPVRSILMCLKRCLIRHSIHYKDQLSAVRVFSRIYILTRDNVDAIHQQLRLECTSIRFQLKFSRIISHCWECETSWISIEICRCMQNKFLHINLNSKQCKHVNFAKNLKLKNDFDTFLQPVCRSSTHCQL